MNCAIICSGTSVEPHKLAKINVPTIGINWSYLAIQSEVHVFTNQTLIKKYKTRIAEITPKSLDRFSNLPVADAFTPKTMLKLVTSTDRPDIEIPGIPDDYDIYKHGWVFAGGAPCALQVAVSLGYKTIVFVGLDLWTGKNMHFYEPDTLLKISEFSGYSRNSLDAAWAVQAKYLNHIKPDLKKRGISVMNTGLSDIFEPIEFDAIW
jgi:hypothetical protein